MLHCLLPQLYWKIHISSDCMGMCIFPFSCLGSGLSFLRGSHVRVCFVFLLLSGSSWPVCSVTFLPLPLHSITPVHVTGNFWSPCAIKHLMILTRTQNILVLICLVLKSIGHSWPFLSPQASLPTLPFFKTLSGSSFCHSVSPYFIFLFFLWCFCPFAEVTFPVFFEPKFSFLCFLSGQSVLMTFKMIIL